MATKPHEQERATAGAQAPSPKDEGQQLLEDLLADAVAKGRRDDPLTIRLQAAVEKGKPKAK